jgi:hypothetical protein
VTDAQQQYNDYYYGTYLPGIAQARMELYAWQNHANEVMLWVVCGLALSGVALAAVQLFWSFKLQQSPQASTIESSSTGIKITSPFVGVIILFLSFSFFLLFVREVYTIKAPAQSAGSATGQAQPSPTAPASTQSGTLPRSTKYGY